MAELIRAEDLLSVVVGLTALAGVTGGLIAVGRPRRSPAAIRRWRILAGAVGLAAGIWAAHSVSQRALGPALLRNWDSGGLCLTVAVQIGLTLILAFVEGRLFRLARRAGSRRREVQRRVAELQRANERLARLALTDDLTDLPNRRAFFEAAAAELSRAKRHRRPFGLIMCDIDHFKQVNDRFGHPSGDAVLSQVARLMRKRCRISDVVARLGGEEFAILVPESGLDATFALAETLRTNIESGRFEVAGAEVKVTISLGVAAHDGPSDTVEAMLARSDEALYAAKAAGRNGSSAGSASPEGSPEGHAAPAAPSRPAPSMRASPGSLSSINHME